MCTEALYHNIALVAPYADIRSLADCSACICIDCSFGLTGCFVRSFFDGPPNRRCLILIPFSSSLSTGSVSEKRDGSAWSTRSIFSMYSHFPTISVYLSIHSSGHTHMISSSVRASFDPLQSSTRCCNRSLANRVSSDVQCAWLIRVQRRGVAP